MSEVSHVGFSEYLTSILISIPCSQHLGGASEWMAGGRGLAAPPGPQPEASSAECPGGPDHHWCGLSWSAAGLREEVCRQRQESTGDNGGDVASPVLLLLLPPQVPAASSGGSPHPSPAPREDSVGGSRPASPSGGLKAPFQSCGDTCEQLLLCTPPRPLPGTDEAGVTPDGNSDGVGQQHLFWHSMSFPLETRAPS